MYSLRLQMAAEFTLKARDEASLGARAEGFIKQSVRPESGHQPSEMRSEQGVELDEQSGAREVGIQP